jgi:hypothetical protein
MESNWKQATEAMTAEAEAEIRNRTDDCNEREPGLPAPTMARCNLPKGHKGPHSFALLKAHSWQ